MRRPSAYALAYVLCPWTFLCFQGFACASLLDARVPEFSWPAKSLCVGATYAVTRTRLCQALEPSSWRVTRHLLCMLLSCVASCASVVNETVNVADFAATGFCVVALLCDARRRLSIAFVSVALLPGPAFPKSCCYWMAFSYHFWQLCDPRVKRNLYGAPRRRLFRRNHNVRWFGLVRC